MTSAMQRLPNGTIELTMTIPWADVTATYEKVIEHMVEHAELPGFRKGKAPRELVEKSIEKTKVYEEALKTIIPKSYNDAVTEQKIHPIVNPKIELKEAAEGKDWIVRALTCEKPTVTLEDYKKAIQDLKSSKGLSAQGGKKIWTPGTEPKEEDKETKPTMDELLMALYGAVKSDLPALLVEHEANRLLSELIDQTKKLGLTVEQYLASTGRTADGVRHEYEEQAKRTLTLEFSLEEIADKEGILVSDDDIDAVIKTAKTDEEKEALKNQRYYLASVLRRQKTLDFLASL